MDLGKRVGAMVEGAVETVLEWWESYQAISYLLPVASTLRDCARIFFEKAPFQAPEIAELFANEKRSDPQESLDVCPVWS